MNVRHRPVHSTPGGSGRLGASHGIRRSRSRSGLINNDNVGYVAIVSFVLLGLALFLFFDFHHHEYDIETGKEIDVVEGEAEEEAVALAAHAAVTADGPDAVDMEEVRVSPRNGGLEEERDVGGAVGGGALRGGEEGPQRPSSKSGGGAEVISKESGTGDGNGQGGPRFVTVVLPSVVNPDGRPKRLDAIASTWGPAARAVYVVHDTMDYLNGANNLVGFSTDGTHYPQVLVVPEKIGLNDGVPRLQHTIRSVHEFINPDFAFFVNDHTFVIPEHLCEFLVGRDSSSDLYGGHAMKSDKGYAFNSGAAGYALSRRTMGDLVKKWDEKDPNCVAEKEAKWLQGNPGLVTAKCLKESMNVNVVDTRDEGGRHRFHAFGFVRTVTGKVDDWYMNKHKALDVIFGPDEHQNQHMPLHGVGCCSTDTVTFHYVEHAETMALYEAREKLKKNQAMTDEELKMLMISVWPSGKDTGHYAHDLPSPSKTEEWSTLISVFRKISPPSGDKNYRLPQC